MPVRGGQQAGRTNIYIILNDVTSIEDVKEQRNEGKREDDFGSFDEKKEGYKVCPCAFIACWYRYT